MLQVTCYPDTLSSDCSGTQLRFLLFPMLRYLRPRLAWLPPLAPCEAVNLASKVGRLSLGAGRSTGR
jgi:hypothetical protein